MIIETYGDFFENVTAQLKCCNEYEAQRIRNSEGFDSGVTSSMHFFSISNNQKEFKGCC